MSKRKAQALTQLEDAKRTLEEEHQERMEVSANVKALEHDIEQMREAIDEEVQSKEDILKQLSKAKAEAQQWRAKFEGEGLVAADELEEERRRRLNKKLEISDHLAELNSKLSAVEKVNSKVCSIRIFLILFHYPVSCWPMQKRRVLKRNVRKPKFFNGRRSKKRTSKC